MAYTDVLVNAPVAQVQAMLQAVFVENGFEIEWRDQYRGVATKGSEVANIFLGALAAYYRIDFEIYAAPGQPLAVRIHKGNTGLWGGLIGAWQVDKKYKEIVDMLTNFFYAQGIYLGRNPP